jgi:eukaryotic-like serine/threonine-protein kinase
MTPEVWERLKPLFHAALDREPGDRTAFIAEACGNDAGLKDNLVALVNAALEPTCTLDRPLVNLNPLDRLRFQTGEVILERFSIRRHIGSGGMGEVYEAWDSELREFVALKTIHPEIARDSSIIERFKEEVKEARQISHPNVCRVYDLFSQQRGETVWFLTMQLLAGRTLQEELRENGPFATKDALVIIEQMIAGLAAAHALGVIHRDFKSSNVMLVPGSNKSVDAIITDFGLAARVTAPADPIRLKGQGTPAYVAPEQWRDGIVGPAADQYSLGVVMCEMITGEQPIREGPSSDVPIRMPVGTKLPARWDRAIRRCLEVRPEDRFRAVTDILPALNPRRAQSTLMRSLTPVLSVALITAVTLLVISTSHPKPTITDLTRVTPADALSTSPSLSGDGSMVAYASDQQEQGSDSSRERISDIWVQQLLHHRPMGPPTRITNDAAENDYPSLSPDGRNVAFSSARDPRGIYIAPARGGGQELLIPGGKQPRFSPDGNSILYWKGSDDLFRPAGGIYVVDLRTRQSRQLAVGFADAHEAVWNSDGKHILFTGCPSSSEMTCWDWWITSIDESSLNGPKPRATGATAALKETKAETTAPFGSLSGWYGDTVLFTGLLRDTGERHVWTLTISPEDGRTRGKPQELLPLDPRQRYISSSLAANHVLALTELSSVVHIWRIDHASEPEPFPKAYPVTQDAEMDFNPSVSANGEWLTFTRGLSNNRQVQIINTRTGEKRDLPAIGRDMRSPLIDDSARTLAYEAEDGELRSVFVVRQDSAEPARICGGCTSPTGWIKDGRGLLLSDATASKIDIYWLATGELQTILGKPGARVEQATWSQANQFALFTVTPDQRKDEKKVQAFVAKFPWGTKEPDSHWVAVTGLSESVQVPRWSADGKTIYYLSDRDHSCCLWAQHFDPRIGRAVGQPFAVQHFSGRRFSPYVISSSRLNLSATGNSVYLNVADLRSSIWIGSLRR